jgi:preprotein translocase subunit SecE
MAKKEKDVKQKTSYFKEMKTELKKVVWPTPKELVNNTVAVIVFVVIIAAIVFILDFCFDNINKYGITRLQETVQSSFQTTEDSDKNNDQNSNANEASENNEENSENENLENVSNESSDNQESSESNTESNE